MSAGGFVWIDSAKDGRQSSGEIGLPGVVIVITDLDGNPVRDGNGDIVGPTSTDASGHYLFTNLKPGRYRTRITYPSGYAPTTDSVGAQAGDSDTLTSMSIVLRKDGDFDVTLDYGLVLRRALPATGRDSSRTMLVSVSLMLLGLWFVRRSRRRSVRFQERGLR